jgi:hypothetical protein
MDINESLLRGILSTVGRVAIAPARVRAIVVPKGDGAKQIAAYYLCDGRTPQTEIGKRAKLDPASLSRSLARWVEAGIVFRVGPDEYPLHLYPLTKGALKSAPEE